MIRHTEINDQQLRKSIRRHTIVLSGNDKLKIYGKLNCKSGRRMKKENRVFFQSPVEAVQQGFRPCAHCMNDEYKNWKHELI